VLLKRTKKAKDVGNEKFDGTEVLEKNASKIELPKYMIFVSSSYYMNNRKKFISHLIPYLINTNKKSKMKTTLQHVMINQNQD
jgi:hypothetical protein